MTLKMVPDEDKPIIEELEKQSDRATALIAAAYLEQRLLLAINRRTHRHAKVEKDFYRASGPVGSFSAKIDLGLLLGIYENFLYQMLHTVREIRNEFAHKSQPIDFSTENIAALCRKLKIKVESELKDDTTGEVTRFDLPMPQSEREAFINATKFCLFAMNWEISHAPSRAPAPAMLQGLDHLLTTPEKARPSKKSRKSSRAPRRIG